MFDLIRRGELSNETKMLDWAIFVLFVLKRFGRHSKTNMCVWLFIAVKHFSLVKFHFIPVWSNRTWGNNQCSCYDVIWILLKTNVSRSAITIHCASFHKYPPPQRVWVKKFYALDRQPFSSMSFFWISFTIIAFF